MIEFCYKLNLPDTSEILKTDYTWPEEGSFLFKPESIDSIIRKEYQTINNIHFDFCLIFAKTPGHQGEIHCDGDRNSPSDFHWGINFVYSGEGLLEFWKPEEANTTFIIDRLGQRLSYCKTNSPPFKSYHQTKGSAYLVNASVPHRATALKDRAIVSMRPLNMLNDLTWDQVVKRFSNLFT